MDTVHDKLDPAVMAPLFAVVAMDAMSSGVILPLLPFYAQKFGATALAIGALVASFSLAQLVAAPWLGRLSDRYGRKPVLVGSQIGTLASLILLALAGQLWLVFVARLIDGLTSGNLSVASALAIDSSSSRTRKQAIGIVSAAMGVGLMIGPALSALLAHLSITAPIWGAAILSLLSVIATTVFLPADKPAAAKAIVPPRKDPSQPRSLPQGALPVLFALSAFYLAFAMYTSQLALFLNARFAWHGVPLGPGQVGLAFTAAGAINIFIQLFAMKRLGRLGGETQLAMASVALLIAGFIGMAFARGFGLLVPAMILASIGSSLLRPTLLATLSLTAEPQQQGALMGLNTSLMATSTIVGPLLAGILIGQGWFAGWAMTIAGVTGVVMTVIIVSASRHRWPAPQAPQA